MRSALVPLDRALLSSYRLSIVTIPLPVTVLPQFVMQILTGGSAPQISSSRGGDRGPCNNVTSNHTKWHLIPSIDFSRVHERNRRPDGQITTLR